MSDCLKQNKHTEPLLQIMILTISHAYMSLLWHLFPVTKAVSHMATCFTRTLWEFRTPTSSTDVLSLYEDLVFLTYGGASLGDDIGGLVFMGLKSKSQTREGLNFTAAKAYQDRQCTYIVTLRRVHETTVAIEK
jgi:hypothetical protein